jgi:hypothetical protein
LEREPGPADPSGWWRLSIAEEGFLAAKHPRARLAAAAELVHYRHVSGGENPRINGASSLLDCAKVGLRQATYWRRWPAVGFDHQGWRSASPL